LKTASVLFLAILSQAVGNVYLTRGMKAISVADSAEAARASLAVSRYLEAALRAATSAEIVLGTLCLIGFFILYSAVLSWADLSFVLPATAFGYVLNVGAGHYFLNEAVSPTRWIGSIIITLGVVFVSRSGPRSVQAMKGLQ
jgi:drug/metabolite transporter (DMT)-like permease